MNTAAVLKDLRLKLCLNQSELGRKLGVTVGAVASWENGRRKPSFATIRKIIELAKRNKIKITFQDIREE